MLREGESWIMPRCIILYQNSRRRRHLNGGARGVTRYPGLTTLFG